MQIKDTPWQGHGGYWQPLFIRENMMAIAYAAWSGYLQHGRGMVVCDIDLPAASVNWGFDSVDYQIAFMPMPEAVPHIQQLELATLEQHRLNTTLACYNPECEVILLLNCQGRIEVNVLQNLAIAPADCYAQVCQRWDEFQLKPSSGKRLG